MKKTVLPLAPASVKIFFIFFSFLLIAANVKSQVLWSAPTGQAWLINTNWTGNIVPATSDIAQFDINPTSGVLGIGINMNGGTNNGANNQAVGAIEITNGRSANLLIGNSSTSTAGTFTLKGATVNGIANIIIRNNSTGMLTIDNTQAFGNQTMGVALGNTTENNIYADNTGNIVINSIVSGVGMKLSVNGSGTGIVQLNAANTYSGLSTVNATTLQLNNTGGNTLPVTNDVMINNGGTLQISTNQTLNNLTLNTGGALTIDNGVTLTINGTFNQNGGTITVIGTGKITYGVGAALSYGASILQLTNDVEFPATSGPTNLTINNSNGVTLHATRTLGGTLTLTTGNLTIGNNNLTTGSITGGSPTSYIVTNGTGKLIRQNISNAYVPLPIGTSTTYNPLAIGDGANLDYAVRVDTGFSYNITDSSKAVKRTWYVTASATPGSPVSLEFYYTGTPATDAGSAFSLSQPINLGLYLSNPPNSWWGWYINNPPNLPQTFFPGWNMYYVNTSVVSFLGNVDLPMVIGNDGAVLAISRSVDLSVQKQSSKAILNWVYNNVSSIREVAIERSANGRSFDKLATVPSLITTYTDDNLLPGTNYYRIKVTDINGKITYSSIAAIINATDGFKMVALLPNVVQTDMQVSLAAAQKTKLEIVITDVTGRPVNWLQFPASAGSNLFNINVSKLAAGMYYITAATATGEAKTLRFVKQ